MHFGMATHMVATSLPVVQSPLDGTSGSRKPSAIKAVCFRRWHLVVTAICTVHTHPHTSWCATVSVRTWTKTYYATFSTLMPIPCVVQTHSSRHMTQQLKAHLWSRIVDDYINMGVLALHIGTSSLVYLQSCKWSFSITRTGQEDVGPTLLYDS